MSLGVVLWRQNTQLFGKQEASSQFSLMTCVHRMTFSGALFDGEDVTPLEAAFQHGINMVNDDRAVLMRSRVFGTIDKIPQARDSFKASKKGSSDCILW